MPAKAKQLLSVQRNIRDNVLAPRGGFSGRNAPLCVCGARARVCGMCVLCVCVCGGGGGGGGGTRCCDLGRTRLPVRGPGIAVCSVDKRMRTIRRLP